MFLASGSPRRRELLGLLGVPFGVIAADVDERPLTGETGSELVVRLAAAKAKAGVAQLDPDERSGALVLGADTVVVVDGDVLGKPGDDDTARAMLRRLSGRSIEVVTGVALATAGETQPRWQCRVGAAVTFVELDEATIEWYVATGEPHDKAGGYALQGAGAALVAEVVGSPSAVIGLPLAEVYGAVRHIGRSTPAA